MAGVGFLSRVLTHVSGQVMAAVEGLAAIVALEGLLARVHARVHLQSLCRAETFAAHVAHVAPHMRLDVTLEALVRVEALTAHAAHVFGVRFDVIGQRDDGVEALPANFAAEGGLGLPRGFLLGLVALAGLPLLIAVLQKSIQSRARPKHI